MSLASSQRLSRCFLLLPRSLSLLNNHHPDATYPSPLHLTLQSRKRANQKRPQTADNKCQPRLPTCPHYGPMNPLVSGAAATAAANEPAAEGLLFLRLIDLEPPSSPKYA